MPEHAADEPLGLEHPYPVGLRRLAVHAGATGSFVEASHDLHEYCRLDLSPTTISDLCQHEAPKMYAWRQKSPELPQDFIEATGHVEVTMDGTRVNTSSGWKEVKVALISKRVKGNGGAVGRSGVAESAIVWGLCSD